MLMLIYIRKHICSLILMITDRRQMIDINTYTHLNTYTCTQINIYTYEHMHVCTYEHMYMYACIHI